MKVSGVEFVMSEIGFFVSSMSIITLDHMKGLKNETPDTLTRRSTWLAQKALETTSSLN